LTFFVGYLPLTKLGNEKKALNPNVIIPEGETAGGLWRS
jgi:hypothetical protein